jgi:uncharacterized protein YacL (UPF0231 family)
MRKALKRIAVMAVFALVAVCASAQEVVNVGGIQLHKSMNHQQVVEWFEKSSDKDILFVLERTETSSTGVKKYFVTKYFWDNGKKKVMDMTLTETPVKTNSQGYVKTTTDQMTSSQKESFLKGQADGYDPEHRNPKGEKRHKFGVAALGGANLVEGQLNPSATLRLLYETCHFSFEIEGTYSRSKHTETSSVAGTNYTTFLATGNVVYKFLQNKTKTAFVGIGINGGYGYQKTDKDETALLFSKNFGFTGGGFLRAQGVLSRKFRLIGEVGYKFYPKVLHDGGNQEWDANGFYANVGLAYLFDLK